jgi:hypothetical protein
MSTSVKTSLRARVLMVATSVLVTLCVLEWVVFPLVLARTPLRLHIYLDEGIRVLAQSSKDSLVPRRWVALAGDSYAQGRGDWLLSQNPNRNGPFHSAHVIHERTGRDVLSFGRGGTGAIRGAIEAVAKFRYLARSLRFPLSPPDTLLFYFYEGNDLNDTLLELFAYYGSNRAPDEDIDPEQAFAGLLQRAAEDAPDYFRRVFAHPDFGVAADLRRRMEHGLAVHPLTRRLERPRLLDELYFAHFLGAVLTGEWIGRSPPASPDEDVFPLQRQRPSVFKSENFLRVHDREVRIAVELQGPAPDLSEAETDAALWAFEQSLAFLDAELAGVRRCVVYIPSPAASYEPARGEFQLQLLGQRPRVYPREIVEARSRDLRRRVAEIAARSGSDFVDPTPQVRLRARDELLHGPTDVRHFNRAGYTVLGEAASRCVPD